MTIQFMSISSDPAHSSTSARPVSSLYQGFLGFKVDWDHRFDNNLLSTTRQVSRGDLILHLSEHSGDGSPGARLRVMMRSGENIHGEISGQRLPLHAAWS